MGDVLFPIANYHPHNDQIKVSKSSVLGLNFLPGFLDPACNRKNSKREGPIIVNRKIVKS